MTARSPEGADSAGPAGRAGPPPAAVASDWGRRVAAMAVIAALGVAVIYVPQPIQTLVAAEFGVPVTASGAATVAVQAGYALGIVLLVSLGDRFAARSQVSVQLVATALALGAAALSPAYGVYVVLCFVAGATATVGQLLVAAALRLAPAASRARTAAVLLGSFVVGLFAVRTALGTVAEQFGWRTVVAGTAILLLTCVPLSLRFAPREAPADPPGYGRILASIPRIIRASAPLRLLTATHVLCFAAFIGIWSMTTVYAVSSLRLSVAGASLLGLAGLAGGIATILVAPLHSVVGVRRSLAVCLAALLAGTLVLALAPQVPALTALALFLVSFGMSSAQVTTQARALASVEPSRGSRANTVFMAATFLGGALASALAEQLFRLGGFAAVGAMASVLVVGAIGLALAARRRGIL